MPAAAVIPAQLAYIKVVAVKKLVVGSASRTAGSPPVGANWFVGMSCRRRVSYPCGAWAVPVEILLWCSSLSVEVGRHVYFEQIRVLKAGQVMALNIFAWNNGIGLRSHFVGFKDLK